MRGESKSVSSMLLSSGSIPEASCAGRREALAVILADNLGVSHSRSLQSDHKNIYYKNNLDPIQIYKESLFSNWYIISCVKSHSFWYIIHMHRSFWKVDFILP